MAKLNAAARRLIESGALAHLVTINEDGSPQVALVWVGLDGDQLVAAHLSGRQRKLANIRRDPRVAVSFESAVTNDFGLREYLVVHGRAEVTEGGAPELLQRLARTYIGPDAVFPPMPDPPAGYLTRITVERIGGNGNWSE
ncbi:MAG TPA: PPOX class F420-dependent oxidoreductase [Actinophytocola sp.]|uniref:PPOX class F420-dependent oxidoreductase n=1 Tax=Actinophytocola sp. TaxID=1872138 RepID=UPI002DDD858F|nr:PPOX class F420-dependent oxidoreductase [Actinophytocola sp.]HEV2781128.1 PPOX class F420-dependent oxidoreductase [Actinophytocola sp.]